MRFNKFLNEENVANPDYIAKDLIGFAHSHGIRNKFIEKWLETTVKRHIINNEVDALTLIDDDIYDELTSNKNSVYWGYITKDQFKIIQKDYKAQRNIFIFTDEDASYSDIWATLEHIFDWWREEEQTRDIRMNVEQAHNAANNYFETKNKRSTEKFHEDQIKILKKYSDGSYWCSIIGQDELNREGKLMNHCVSGYFDKVRNGSNEIYSYRTKDNKPHITIEYKDKGIIQCKLNSNARITDSKYNDQILDFIKIKKVEYPGYDLRTFMSLNKIFQTKKGLQFADDISFKDFEFTYASTTYTLPKEKVKILFDKFFEYPNSDSYLGYKLMGSDKQSKFFSIAVSKEPQMFTTGIKLTSDFYKSLDFFFIIKTA